MKSVLAVSLLAASVHADENEVSFSGSFIGSASGSVSAYLDDDCLEVAVDFALQDANTIGYLHLHQNVAGQPKFAYLGSNFAKGSASESATYSKICGLTSEIMDNLRAGLVYVNVHNEDDSGVSTATLSTEEGSGRRRLLDDNEAEEIGEDFGEEGVEFEGTFNNMATGSATAVLSGDCVDVTVDYTLTSPQTTTYIHLHSNRGECDDCQPKFAYVASTVDATAGRTKTRICDLSEEVITEFGEGKIYVNLHGLPAGEPLAPAGISRAYFASEEPTTTTTTQPPTTTTTTTQPPTTTTTTTQPPTTTTTTSQPPTTTTTTTQPPTTDDDDDDDNDDDDESSYSVFSGSFTDDATGRVIAVLREDDCLDVLVDYELTGITGYLHLHVDNGDDDPKFAYLSSQVDAAESMTASRVCDLTSDIVDNLNAGLVYVNVHDDAGASVSKAYLYLDTDADLDDDFDDNDDLLEEFLEFAEKEDGEARFFFGTFGEAAVGTVNAVLAQDCLAVTIDYTMAEKETEYIHLHADADETETKDPKFGFLASNVDGASGMTVSVICGLTSEDLEDLDNGIVYVNIHDTEGDNKGISRAYLIDTEALNAAIACGPSVLIAVVALTFMKLF